MKKIILILHLSVFATYLQAQNEAELVSVGYRTIAQASLENSNYSDLNDVSSAHTFYTFSFNYGQPLKDTTFFILYGLSYENVNQKLDLTNVTQDTDWDLLPENYYQQPQYSQLSLSVGVSKSLPKGWSLSGIFYTNVIDDFFKPELPTNINFGGMAFIEKEHNKRFTYGAGLLLVELERKIFASPVVSFKYQNEKRGIEALIPAKLRLWQKINKKSYLEASVYNNFYSIEYQPDNDVISTDILSFKPELTYNYLWEDFLKLSIGIDLPLRDVTVSAKKETFKYQQNSLGFNIGLSLVIGRD